MGQAISRDFAWEKLTLTNSETTTPDLNKTGYAFGEIYIPSGSSITTLTYYSTPRPETEPGPPAYSDEWMPCQDSSGVAVTQTVAASKCYPLPVAIAGAGMIRIKANAAGVVYVTLTG